MIRFDSFQRLIVRYSANYMLQLYFHLSKNKLEYRLNSSNENLSNGIIISLTSFSARIHRAWLAIETLLRQTKKPDGIILWLSSEQFPDLSHLPTSLLAMRDRGLRIELRDGDLRSHKKFYYVKKEYPDATIVLADDDILYPETMLEELCAASVLYPGKVVGRFTKRMEWSPARDLLPYASWKTVNDGRVGTDYFFGSGGGTLIPPAAVHLDVLNKEAFLKCCPFSDDIWLNAMCRLVSQEMVSISRPFTLLPIINRDSTALTNINNGQRRNDEQLAVVREYCRDVYEIDPFESIEFIPVTFD